MLKTDPQTLVARLSALWLESWDARREGNLGGFNAHEQMTPWPIIHEKTCSVSTLNPKSTEKWRVTHKTKVKITGECRRSSSANKRRPSISPHIPSQLHLGSKNFTKHVTHIRMTRQKADNNGRSVDYGKRLPAKTKKEWQQSGTMCHYHVPCLPLRCKAKQKWSDWMKRALCSC